MRYTPLPEFWQAPIFLRHLSDVSVQNQKSLRDELCVVIIMLRVDATLPVRQEVVERRRAVCPHNRYTISVGPHLHSDQHDVDVHRLVQLHAQPLSK